MAELYYYLNDMFAELYGVVDIGAGTFINNATVTVTLLDTLTDTQIAGQTWPLTLDYVTDSNGNYRGILTDALVVTIGQALTAEITASGGSDLQGFWQVPVTVAARTS